VSPFAGVGLAHFHEIRGGASANNGAFQFRDGVDFITPLRVLSIRAETRDFVTGRPGIEDFGRFTSNRFNIFLLERVLYASSNEGRPLMTKDLRAGGLSKF
jgi:hypothetical protein